MSYAVHVPDAESPVVRRGHYVMVILNQRYCLDWAIASPKKADAFVALSIKLQNRTVVSAEPEHSVVPTLAGPID
jgi:hypothetical protein